MDRWTDDDMGYLHRARGGPGPQVTAYRVLTPGSPPNGRTPEVGNFIAWRVKQPEGDPPDDQSLGIVWRSYTSGVGHRRQGILNVDPATGGWRRYLDMPVDSIEVCDLWRGIHPVENPAISAELWLAWVASLMASRRSSAGHLHAPLWLTVAVGAKLARLWADQVGVPPQELFTVYGNTAKLISMPTDDERTKRVSPVNRGVGLALPHPNDLTMTWVMPIPAAIPTPGVSP